jgi:hypothetical protein
VHNSRCVCGPISLGLIVDIVGRDNPQTPYATAEQADFEASWPAIGAMALQLMIVCG